MGSQQPAHVRGAQAAQALRHREQLGFEPIDIWLLLDRLEVPVAVREFGTGFGDGLYIWEDDEPLIVINASARPSRQRFTAAHELGHHEMHRFEADQLLLTDENIFGSQDAWEIEANAFAAYLLAPDEGVRQRLAKHTGDDITPDMVVETMAAFGLSYNAMTYRLLNVGLINRAQRAALIENALVEERMRRAGIDEDGSFKSPTHLPRTHINAALRLYEDHVVTPNRLGELLDMSHNDAIEFAQARGIRPTAEHPVDDDAVDALLRDR
jgi:Zn-dependent peptidase ImmA (M78 family)